MKSSNATHTTLPARLALVIATAIGAALLHGCGGLPPDTTPDEPQGAVVVIVVEEGTNAPLGVPATVIVGGVRGVQGVNDEQLVLRNVPVGTGTPPTQPMTISAPGYVTSATQAQLNVTTATWIQVAVTPADTSATGTVEGAVTSFDTGAPVVNAFIEFKIEGNPEAEGVAGFTDNEGRFIVGGIPTGANQMTVLATDFLELSRRVVVIVDDDGTTPDENVVLISGSTRINVVGRVLDVLTRQPIAGATVAIGDEPTVTTDGDGRFTVPDVLVGERKLQVTHPNRDPYRVDIVVMPGMAGLVIELFEAAQDPPVGPSTITGQVTVTGAADNSGATVTATVIGEANPTATTTTNEAGAYGLFVPPGLYRVTVRYGGNQLSRDVTVPIGGVIVDGINFAIASN